MLPPHLLQQLQQKYNWTGNIQVQQISDGLINHTWKVLTNNGDFILQAINTHVFPHPEKMDVNLQMLAAYFFKEAPDYLFVGPVTNVDGKTMMVVDNTFYRVFPFIQGSHTQEILSRSEDAFEAAQQFGKFTAALAHFNTNHLQITIPFFHHLSFRYWQFKQAWQQADDGLKKQAQKYATQIAGQTQIIEKFNYFIHKNTCLQRTMHHDTKISNILFNEAGKGVVVIDLDTVMPGFFFSDMGDMMRTYLSPVGEEEKDISLIEVRPDFLQAVTEGYLSAMVHVLTDFENEHLLYSGQIMTYMQALRFLTDYLQHNCYYACSYADQNLVRTANQLQLLAQMQNISTPKPKQYFIK